MQLAFLGCRDAALQVVGEKLVIAIPLPIVVERHQEHVALVEARKLRDAIGPSGQCVAKRSAQAVQDRRAMKKDARLVRLPLQNLGREAQVTDPAIRARSDEDDIDLLAEDRLARLEVHILERPLERPAGRRIDLVLRGRHAGRDWDAHPGVRPVGDHRLERRGVDRDRPVVGRAVVGRQLPPRSDGGVPGRSRRRVGPARDVLECRVVRRNQAGTCAALDRHVADRHPLLHRQGADGLARVLEHVAGPATDPDSGDEGEDDVLAAHARDEPSVDPDLVGLRLPLEERLRREDHLDLARPDPERQRAERAVGRRVRIAADDRHPGLGEPELRSDHVDDPLVRRAEAMQRDGELAAVRLELGDLCRSHRIGHRQRPRVGRGGVVRRGDRPFGVTDAQPARAEPGEGLRRRHLVDEVEVDREDRRRPFVLADDVVVPDLLDDRAGAVGVHRVTVFLARSTGWRTVRQASTGSCSTRRYWPACSSCTGSSRGSSPV